MYRRWVLKPIMYVSAGYISSKLFGLIARFRNMLNDNNSLNNTYLSDRNIFFHEIAGLYLGLFGTIILDRFNLIVDNTPKLIEQ